MGTNDRIKKFKEKDLALTIIVSNIYDLNSLAKEYNISPIYNGKIPDLLHSLGTRPKSNENKRSEIASAVLDYLDTIFK